MQIKEEIFQAIIEIVKYEPVSITGLDIDWNDPQNIKEFIYVAETSGLAPLCYSRVKNFSTGLETFSDLVEALKRNYLVTLLNNRQRLDLYKEVYRILNAENIPVALLKGMALSIAYYPDEGLRPMGDLDLLVPSHLVCQARDILLANGAEATHVPISNWHEMNHSHVRPLKLHPYRSLIELHSKLFATGSPYQPKNWNWEQVTGLKETPSGNYLLLKEHYMLYHLAMHLFYTYKIGAIRLGWIIDISIFLDSSSGVNKLMNELLSINPPFNKHLLQVIGWAAKFSSQRVKDDLASFLVSRHELPPTSSFFAPDDVKDLHRNLVFTEIMNTPGVLNKLTGLFYQLFPSPEYMARYHGLKRKRELPLRYFQRLFNFSRIKQ